MSLTPAHFREVLWQQQPCSQKRLHPWPHLLAARRLPPRVDVSLQLARPDGGGSRGSMRSKQRQQVQAAAAQLGGTAGPGSRSKAAAPMVIVVMGVSGCGKSTVASLLSQHLSCPFYEGDAYHPAANIEKMRSGTPLTDADREPWLARLAEIIQQHCQQGEPAVLSCSALKPQYRQLLRGTLPLVTASSASGNSSASSSGRGSASGNDRISSGSGSGTSSSSVAVDGNGSGMAAECDSRAEGENSTHGGCSSSSSSSSSNSSQDSCGPVDQLFAAARAGMEQGSGVGFVLLEPSREQLQAWVAQRATAEGHFMPPALLDSQLATLEYSPDELLLHFRGDPFPEPQQVVECVMLQLAGAA